MYSVLCTKSLYIEHCTCVIANIIYIGGFDNVLRVCAIPIRVAFYNVQCTLYIVQYTVYNVQCRIYSINNIKDMYIVKKINIVNTILIFYILYTVNKIR